MRGKNKKIKDGKQRNKGFSLVEVLVAIVILALVAAPILQSFLTSAKINDNSKELLAATNLAQIIMEDLTSQTYDNNIKVKYTNPVDPSADIIPSVIGSMSMNQLTLSSATISEFESKLHTDFVADNSGTKERYVIWSGATECVSVNLHSVKQDDYTFDVIFVLTPSEGVSSSDKFFTYDIELRVYKVNDGRHYENRLVTIKGAVANQK